MQFFSVVHGKCRRSFMFTERIIAKDLISSFLRGIEQDVYIISNGRKVCEDDIIQDGCVYHIMPRLRGGKGGFGSMLRAIGAQIDKTNNREACRDLSGRRMRDVNNEKQMKEWLSKQAEKEKEREERRRERWERRKAMPNHKFDDPLYDQQKALVTENLEDALQKGLKKSRATTAAASSTVTMATTSSGGNRKRTAESAPGPSSKVRKNVEWLGIDMDNLSDLDSDEGEGQSDESEGQSDVAAGACAKAADSSSKDSGSDQSSSPGSVHNDKSHQVIKGKTAKTHCPDKFIIPLESNLEDNEEKMDFQIKLEGSENASSVEETETCDVRDSVGKETKHRENVMVEPVSSGSGDQACDHSSCASISADSMLVKPETAKTETLTLEDCKSVEDVETLGLDKLKEELMSRGLKCGGTLTERAQRLYSVKGLTQDQIDPALFAKPAKGKKNK